MPNPIPEWDLARRLVKYIGFNQITGKLVTVREATVTTGIGRDRMESELKEKNIKYKIFSDKEPSGKDIIALEYVPKNLALDAGIANSELYKSYQIILERDQQGEIRAIPRRRRRLKKKQREQMKVTEFWSRKEQEHESA